MTSPPEQITVRCPNCGEVYEDWTRASVNLVLDNFDEDYRRACSTATCPFCKAVVELDTLVVDGSVWTFPGGPELEPVELQPVDLDSSDAAQELLGRGREGGDDAS